MILSSQLNQLFFKHSHNCLLNEDGVPGFEQVCAMPADPSIYIWVSPVDEKNYELLYVGKAGHGINIRLSQHMGGFNHSSSGQKNKELIVEKLKTQSIQVFTRLSARQTLFDVTVSLYSAEEEAFCLAYNPIWNRAQFNN